MYTDGVAVYGILSFLHEPFKHSIAEYVRNMAVTNEVESFWPMPNRAEWGTFHRLSPKHFVRNIQEFAAKHNMRESGARVQMRDTVARMVGRNLMYHDPIADDGHSSAAW